VEALLVPGSANVKTLADLKGKTIGVKGDLAPAVVAMLNRAGLQRGRDYKERQLSGFNPQAHIDSGIDALPVFQSNEPGQLTALGGKYADYQLFRANDNNTPGSFGVIFTSNDFARDHPTVVEDFVRADLKGFADAVADPAAASAVSVKRIKANPGSTLTEAGEIFRWNV
jgi:ABC-type nitrate/sulfonate/bicarbonate transport system substrate-binding protein